MKQKFTVLFDLDGTLIDTAPDLITCTQPCNEKIWLSNKNIR